MFNVYVPERIIVCYLKEGTANIRRKPVVSLMWAIKGAPANHDTQTCCLGAMLNYVSSCHFSWVVYCGKTRPRGCLLSARLTQMWPRTFIMRILLQWVTEKKFLNTKVLSWAFGISFYKGHVTFGTIRFKINPHLFIYFFRPSSKYIIFHLPQRVIGKQHRISHRKKIKRSNLTHAFWNTITEI